MLQPTVSEIPSQITEPIVEEPTQEVADMEPEIPEYMFNDAGMVGFSDSQIQSDMYNLAIHGNIPLFGEVSVLEIGAGRGDLFTHITSQLSALNVTYTGYESNQLLAKIGNIKLEDQESASVVADNFLTAEITETYDRVYIVGSLDVDYGENIQPWEHLEMMLRKALDVTNVGGIATCVLLHDNGGEDNYRAFPIPNVTDLILKFNMPFDITYGSIPSIYKLSIKKEPIFITQ